MNFTTCYSIIGNDNDESVLLFLQKNHDDELSSSPPKSPFMEEDENTTGYDHNSSLFIAFLHNIYLSGICNYNITTTIEQFETTSHCMDIANFEMIKKGAEKLFERGEEHKGALPKEGDNLMDENSFLLDNSMCLSLETSSMNSPVRLSTNNTDGSVLKRVNGRNTYLKVKGISKKLFTFKFNVLHKSSDGRGTRFGTDFKLDGIVSMTCSRSDENNLCHYINLKDIKKKKCVLDVLRKEFSIARGQEVWIQIHNCQERVNVYCQKNKKNASKSIIQEKNIFNVIEYNYETSEVSLEDVENLTRLSSLSITPSSVVYEKTEYLNVSKTEPVTNRL